MTSMPLLPSTSSSRPSTISWMRRRSRSTVRAVKALLTSVRRRVWCGGSDASIDRGISSVE
jgi:hypothetical protein